MTIDMSGLGNSFERVQRSQPALLYRSRLWFQSLEAYLHLSCLRRILGPVRGLPPMLAIIHENS